MKALKHILLSVLALCLFGVGFLGGKTLFTINSITTDISQTNEDLGIDNSSLLQIDTLKKENDDVINIALFGIDSRVQDSEKGTRSDSIIILTIDQINKEIKLSSIMRDTYVSIPGYQKTKINHAYAYGGAQLAIKTLNSNFGLDIRDFVTVDFFGLEKIIDAIGGVTLTVEDYEIKEINKFIKEVADIEGKKPTYLKEAGTQKLNGMQAVSFGRIRKVGNGDYERTERQREVLISLFNEFKNISKTKLISLANTCSPYIKTSMDISEGIKIALSVLSGDYTISQNRFPQDDASEGRTINGMWVLAANIKQTKNDILEYIYGTSMVDTNEEDDEYYDYYEESDNHNYPNKEEDDYNKKEDDNFDNNYNNNYGSPDLNEDTNSGSENDANLDNENDNNTDIEDSIIDNEEITTPDKEEVDNSNKDENNNSSSNNESNPNIGDNNSNINQDSDLNNEETIEPNIE